MNWIISTFVALLTSGLGLFVAGFVAAGCVSWYRISGFEGKSGYFMGAIAILGGMAGFVLGLVASRIVAAGPDAGFLKAIGYSWGIVIAIGAVSALVAWLLADIPPKIAGRELMLEVEVRMPITETNKPVDPEGKASLTIGSVINHRQRASWDGELRMKDARLENGRWIIPGSVYLFTVRGMRSIDARTDGKPLGAFLVPLPGRPGRKFEEWSQWEPRPPAGRPPWPDTNPSYRFRVQRIEPPPPPPDAEQVEAERFAALPSDAPLQDYLSFTGKRATEERMSAVMKVVEARSSELAWLIGSSDEFLRESALETVPRLATVTPEIRDAILAEGRAIGDGIRAFNQMKSDDPQFYNVQVSLRSRFNSWRHAWWATQQKLRLDGRLPVQEIYDLAVVRAGETSMDEIEINARVILEALKPPAPTAVESISAAASSN